MNTATDHPRHRIVIGGGAGGLELATRLGNTLGRRRQATHRMRKIRRRLAGKPLEEYRYRDFG